MEKDFGFPANVRKFETVFTFEKEYSQSSK